MIDTCILCGEYVPEGNCYCYSCGRKYLSEDEIKYPKNDDIESNVHYVHYIMEEMKNKNENNNKLINN